MRPIAHRIVRRRQAGMSNLQIMIGVLIGAILITGGIAMLTQIDKAKVDNEVRELTRLKKKTVSLGAQRGTFDTVTQQTVIQLDFFPSSVVSGPLGSRTISNQWGGQIQVSPQGIVVPWDGLLFRYTGMPAAACKQLGLQISSLASGIQIGGTWVKGTPAIGSPLTVNPATLITACDAGGSNVTFDVYLVK